MKKTGLGLLSLVIAAALVMGCGGGSSGGSGDDDTGIVCNGKMTCNNNNVCTLTGTFCKDMTLVNTNEYVLSGGVFIGNDVNSPTLTIEAGTKIFGLNGTPPGMLVIRRNANINAVGTPANPIVFTSANPDTQRFRGDWGGVIINGKAPVNICGDAPCIGANTPTGEGSSGKYGGSDPADNSGVMKYVRIEFAGHMFTGDDELNGLALQGVGSGTEIDYIQVHMNLDDGIEMFGGNVNIQHIVLTGNADDSFDWTYGWDGMAQFVAIQQHADACDNGIEADNNGEITNATPSSAPILSNFTIVGSPNSLSSDIGILLKAGTEAEVHNSVIISFNEACLDIDEQATWDKAYSGGWTGALAIANTIVYDDNGAATKEFKGNGDEAGVTEPVANAVETWFNAGTNNSVADPLLADAYNEGAPGWLLGVGSPALAGADFTGMDMTFFTNVAYRGAFDGTTDWTAGWTDFPEN